MIECKEALLEQELDRVRDFLSLQSLELDKQCDTTLYLEENSKIIGTISKYKYIIKCVAVDPSYQGEDLTGMLVNKIVEKMTLENIYSYQVYTKPKYKKVFESLGFSVLAESSECVFLEKGLETVLDVLYSIKMNVENNLGKIKPTDKIACSVMNANPFTLGHQYLVETMSKSYDKVIIFLVSEDESLFTYKERTTLAYLSTSRFENVVIVPSTRYAVSSLTFPTYFIHSKDDQTKNIAELDAKIFKEYFMKIFKIDARFVGSETKDYMTIYNTILKDTLGDKLVEIKRNSVDGNVVSASTVRDLLKDHKTIEALKYLPSETHMLIRMLAIEKYGS